MKTQEIHIQVEKVKNGYTIRSTGNERSFGLVGDTYVARTINDLDEVLNDVLDQDIKRITDAAANSLTMEESISGVGTSSEHDA